MDGPPPGWTATTMDRRGRLDPLLHLGAALLSPEAAYSISTRPLKAMRQNVLQKTFRTSPRVLFIRRL
jgi:hypothetical protein